MRVPLLCIFVLTFTVSCPAQNALPKVWRSFTSSNGFSVKYPSGWNRRGISKDRLTIVSSKGGAEGIVIGKGQAMISVVEASQSSLTRVIDHYTQQVDILSKRDVLNTDRGNRACHTLREIVSKEAAVPPEDVPGHVPYMINTAFFCEAKTHVYVTVLRNYEDDKNQGLYQGVALEVAKSLSVDK